MNAVTASPCRDGTSNHPWRKTGNARYSLAGSESEWICKECGLVDFIPSTQEEKELLLGTGGRALLAQSA